MSGSTPTALLAAAVVFLIAGCGGSGTETVTQVRTQTSAAPLTKPEYIAQADAICQQYKATLDEIGQKLDDLGDIDSQDEADQAASLIREAADKARPGLQALQSLQPPTQDASVLGTYVSITSGQLAAFSDLADAYEELDARQIRSLLARIDRDRAKQQGLAQGYGFKVCGAD
jgi:hypothetical protein